MQKDIMYTCNKKEHLLKIAHGRSVRVRLMRTIHSPPFPPAA